MNANPTIDEQLAHLEFGVPCDCPPRTCGNEAEWAFATNCECELVYFYCDPDLRGCMETCKRIAITGRTITCMYCGGSIPPLHPFIRMEKI